MRYPVVTAAFSLLLISACSEENMVRKPVQVKPAPVRPVPVIRSPTQPVPTEAVSREKTKAGSDREVPPPVASPPEATTSKPAEPEPVRKPPPKPKVAPRKPTPNKPRFGKKADIYDPQSPAYRLLQTSSEAMNRFPADGQGNIDWVQALQKGMIAPRAQRDREGK